MTEHTLRRYGLPSLIAGVPRPVAFDERFSGPFVVNYGNREIVGFDLRSFGVNVAWTDSDGVANTAGDLFEFHVPHESAMGSSSALRIAIEIRPLTSQDASWANLDRALATPESAGRRAVVAPGSEPDSSRVSIEVPDDGSWLVIDTSTGQTFSGENVLVTPEPPHHVYDELQNDYAQQADFADRCGQRLLMPESPSGTPVEELEEWDRPPWLIDTVSGNACWKPWNLVVVPAPPDGADIQGLYADDDFAAEHARLHGRVPKVPFDAS